MASARPIGLRQFAHGRFQERRIRIIAIEADLFVRWIPGLGEQRLLDAHSPTDRAAPARDKETVASQVRDHASGAVGQDAFTRVRGMGAQDREEPVFARLSEAEPLRLLLGGGTCRRDLM